MKQGVYQGVRDQYNVAAGGMWCHFLQLIAQMQYFVAKIVEFGLKCICRLFCCLG
jgi:hypothetical protein